MATSHLLLKGGTTIVLSSYTRAITKPPPLHPISLLFSKPTISTTPLPSLSSLSLRHARRHCTAASESLTAVDSPPSSEAPPVRELAGLLDIRVGKVLKAWRHPDAESLYVEEVDVGEEEPRTICSGLVNYVPIDHLQDKKVVVLANLKPRNMRGIKSCGMLMAASDASHENVELLVPPEASIPGERIWFSSEEEKEKQPDAASPNQIQKKKVWESVQPHLKTDVGCVAMLDGCQMMTSAGPVVSGTLTNANIS